MQISLSSHSSVLLSMFVGNKSYTCEANLNWYMVEHCDPDMTYEAVFEVLGAEIQKLGFRNLDFKGNLGPSIEIDQADRVYLEKGNRLTLRQVGKPFTLEPHIANCADYGFKRENIYVIEGDRLVEI